MLANPTARQRVDRSSPFYEQRRPTFFACEPRCGIFDLLASARVVEGT